MDSVRKRLLLVIATAFMCSTVIAGCGRDTVAKVDGRRISREEYYARLERLPYADPTTRQQVEAGAWVLQGLINEVLLIRLAEKKGATPTKEQISERLREAEREPKFRTWLKRMGITEDQVRERMQIEQAFFNLQTKGVTVTKGEVRGYYDKNRRTLFTTPEQAEVEVIFAKNKADADKAMSMLEKGMSFETVARKISIEPTSASQGGYIPPISRNNESIPKSVRDIIFGTKPNQYTQPIQHGDGEYLIFKLLQRRKERTQKFKEVEYAIRQELMSEKGRRKGNINIDRELTELREKADIHVGIERYKSLLLPQAVKGAKIGTEGKMGTEGKGETPKSGREAPK